MSDLINNIVKIKKSKPYIDYKNYHRGNIFGITKMSRRELMHSNFIAWALNPQSTHALGFYPTYLFARALDIIQSSADNFNARKIDKTLWLKFFDDNFIVDVSIEREYPIPIGKNNKNKFVDLLIEITTKDKILPLIVENKVESPENGTDGDQTKEYFDWFENDAKYQDRTKYFEPLYIYLYPEYKTKKQTQEEYIRMTYQELVDYIIAPSAEKCGDVISVNNYKTYLQCLTFQSDNDKGGNTMAISPEERKILDEFVRENEDMLCAVLKQLDGVDIDSIASVTSGIKDHSQYEFMGNTYKKGRLVLAVVKQYIDEGKATDFSDLQKAFPDTLQGKYGVVRLSKKVDDKDKGIGLDGHKRYFVDGGEVIGGFVPNDEVLVCREWGAKNAEAFIQHAINVLKYPINKL
jgi:hypothetical protein